MPREPWMSKAEVAVALDVSPSSVTRHVRPYARVGGQNRYVMSDVERQLRGVPDAGADVVRFPTERTRGAVA